MITNWKCCRIFKNCSSRVISAYLCHCIANAINVDIFEVPWSITVCIGIGHKVIKGFGYIT